ncbi:uncharacterized protein LAJ45_05084 [Morchella importuna]|uniref:uncharacterized protein n=1 Tax=Morchella importuna TaxID=1174673 RepID=UPI001E8EC360|nr:uncharacterized protein LAJ45_05084 [Morchella importuna]KAH8150902.1 hypothetical protein LAJ45_05084 [Morchella importuna]
MYIYRPLSPHKSTPRLNLSSSYCLSVSKRINEKAATVKEGLTLSERVSGARHDETPTPEHEACSKLEHFIYPAVLKETITAEFTCFSL